jgi:hypothetical protein
MNKKTQLNCFSPPVMVATLVIESLLAMYTIWRYKMSEITRLAVITLIALAAFQLSEYFVCTGYGVSAEQWSRAGFVFITLLPPLGLHILHVLAGKPGRRLVYAAYATMAAFIVTFLTYHAAFIGHECTGNYVIFQLGATLGGLYGAYYYGWLLAAIALGVRWLGQLKNKEQNVRRQVKSIRGLIIGYLVFLIPTALANTVKPETRQGIPSIMCGFAVLFALILVFYILPRATVNQEIRLTKTQD